MLHGVALPVVVVRESQEVAAVDVVREQVNLHVVSDANTIEEAERAFVVVLRPNDLPDSVLVSFILQVPHESARKIDKLNHLICDWADDLQTVLDQEIHKRELQVVLVDLVGELEVIRHANLDRLRHLRLVESVLLAGELLSLRHAGLEDGDLNRSVVLVAEQVLFGKLYSKVRLVFGGTDPADVGYFLHALVSALLQFHELLLGVEIELEEEDFARVSRRFVALAHVLVDTGLRHLPQIK